MPATWLLRLVNSRCPVCFKVVGPDSIQKGWRLCCSPEHAAQYDPNKRTAASALKKMDGGGRCC